MSRRLTQRGRERRQQLLETATELFATRGIDATSVSDVCQAVGVGKGVFYWYFESKDALLAELIRDAAVAVGAGNVAAIDGVDDPVERLAAGIRATIRWQAEHPHLVEIFGRVRHDERYAALFRRTQDRAVADVVRHVKDGIVAGQIPDGDPVLLAHALTATTSHLGRTFVHERGHDPAEVAELAVSFCLRGLLGGPPAADPPPTAW